MSSRGLLTSMAVIASAQFATIIIRVMRAKLVAVMLGPAGTGLLAVFANLRELGARCAGLGLPSSGVRELAATRADPVVLARVRRVLVFALALQGGLAMALMWMLREPLSSWLLEDTAFADEIGLVGIAVFFFLLALSQQTILQGLRRIGDLGRVMVLGALLGTVFGFFAIWMLGMKGLVGFILAESVGGFVVALVYSRRLPLSETTGSSLRELYQQWLPMVRLGMAFMLAGLLGTVSLLLVRTHVTRELGLDAAGQFAAAWTIAMIYIGFLLEAMGKDYFPRLSEIIEDHKAAGQLMNDQMMLAFALGGPVLLFMIGMAPWIVQLLYSAEFDTAATLVQWQMVGNVFKLGSWALGFSIVASGRSGLFLLLEFQFFVLFLGFVWLGQPVLGLDAVGIGFLLAYVVSFLVNAAIARYLIDFRWNSKTLRLFAMHAVLAFALLAVLKASPVAGAMMTLFLSVLTAFIGLHSVLSSIGTHGRFVSRVSRAYAMVGWPVKDDG